MTKLETLREALVDSLKDIFNAEQQLLQAIPKMEKKASNSKLKKLFRAHLVETEGQVARLKEIESMIQEKLTGKTCKAMQGLIEEGREVISLESTNEAIIDAMLIGAACRVEHYEMAAYESAAGMAKELGENKIVSLLNETLAEESASNKKLCALSKSEVLAEANTENEDNDDEEDATEDEVYNSRRPSRSGSLIGAAKLLALLALCSSFIVNVSMAVDSDTPMLKNEKEALEYKADNSGRNARDVNETRRTADDQRLAGKDLELLAEIRRSIVANDNLSINAKNVKIVVEKSTVTLRGPVKSTDEKTWIEQASASAAPGYKVINQLEVSPS